MPGDDRLPGNDRSREGSSEEEQQGEGRRTAKEANERAAATSPDSSHERGVLPLVEEQVRVERRQVDKGGVRVSTEVGIRREEIVVELTKDEVEVRRVPVGRQVDGPVEIRREGDVTIIPVLEEVVEVNKRLILKEEVHVRRRSSQRSETHSVDLRYEEPLVERFSPDRDEKE